MEIQFAAGSHCNDGVQAVLGMTDQACGPASAAAKSAAVKAAGNGVLHVLFGSTRNLIIGSCAGGATLPLRSTMVVAPDSNVPTRSKAAVRTMTTVLRLEQRNMVESSSMGGDR